MKKLILFLCALSSVAMIVSCQKFPRDNRLRFSVSANETKASIVTTADIQTEGESFLLDALLEDTGSQHYIRNSIVKLGGSGWEGSEELTWRNSIWTNFWATYPVEAQGRGLLVWPEGALTGIQEKNPGFSYDMTYYTSAELSMSTPDLLAAYCRSKWNEDDKTGGVVKFELQHLMSAISFSTGDVDTGYGILDVTIAGIHCKGTCALTGSTTKSLRDTVSVAWMSEDTPDEATGFTCNADCFGSDHWLFLIPQQLNSPAVLKAKVSGNGGTETKEIYLTGYTWKPGYKYQYTISYHEAQDELVVKINEYQNSTGQWTD